MAAILITVNLEEGMPTVTQAQSRLIAEMGRARAAGAKAVKLIHGYGSSGVGGKLKISVRQFLNAKKRRISSWSSFLSIFSSDIFSIHF